MSHPVNDIVLSVRDLVVRFEGERGRDVAVLHEVSFDVFRGETLVIMGGSGCGKSTLLNCLIGELTPAAGRVVYRLPSTGEVDVTRADRATMDRVRKRFGILFQSGALFSSLTVADNVALPLREHSLVEPAVVDIVVAMKLQQVQMLPHRDKFPAQLSGGQRKRVGLARATALDPEILFYDEPSAGLDPVTATAIDELIMDLSDKLSVTSVVVTHDMDSAFRIADRMIMLDAGRVLKIAPRADFERIRNADPSALQTDLDKRIHYFVRGGAGGVRPDGDGLTLYARILDGKSTTATRTQ